MWTLNDTLDRDVKCASVGACFIELPGGVRRPVDSAARAKDCIGVIPAGQPHFYQNAGWAGPDVDPDEGRYCRHCVREMNDGLADAGPILVRVELTYSDGVVRYLEDEAADDWGQQVGSASVMAWAHGHHDRPLPWKEMRRSGPGKGCK